MAIFNFYNVLRISLAGATALVPLRAEAQCALANPSFEVPGQGGAVFGGWNQFGVFGSSTDADHGQASARLVGANLGGYDVSGYWQPLDTSPGERWEVTVRVLHESGSPLTDLSRALVNVEWRDAAGDLISFESHDAADPSSPTDTWMDFTVITSPAPAEAVKARLLLGVIQGPNDPVPVVRYDSATFHSLTSPTMNEQQWIDFPGGRVVHFAGRNWRVKGPGYYGPGPNHFADGEDNTWVDADGALHLTIRNEGGTWYSTELVLEEPLGYGDYVFTTKGRLDTLDPHTVLGLFVWQYGPCYDPGILWWNPFNEIDIEFSRWGDANAELGYYTAQPWDWPGNQSVFDPTFSEDEITTHAFRWSPQEVEFRSWRGGPADEAPANMIHAWTYLTPHLPRPEQPRVHLNLWHVSSTPATDQEVVLTEFNFVPMDGIVDVDDSASPVLPPGAHLLAARPNPLRTQTTIGFELDEPAHASLIVFDAAGRRVRSLVDGVHAAGRHRVVWDGRDESGARMGAGVYFYHLRTSEGATTRRMIFLR